MYRSRLATKEFLKNAASILSPEQNRAINSIMQRIGQGNLKGQCLVIPWLWEVKLPSKRLYYVVQGGNAIFVSASTKNEQAIFIKHLIRQKEQLLTLAERITRNE